MSVRFGFIIAAVVAAFSTQAFGQDMRTAGLPATMNLARAQVLQTTLPPMGWVDFCQRYNGECDSNIRDPAEIRLSRKTWRDLAAVNSHFNRTIVPVTDKDHWGAEERWDYPDDGKGDCEDYVLAKRRMLVEMGYPLQALLVTVVRDNLGEGHAVLTIVTDRGDLVLDNRRQDILSWTLTGYSYVKRQATVAQNIWVSLGAPQPPLATASR